mgnify:CR=1 FL=1
MNKPTSTDIEVVWSKYIADLMGGKAEHRLSDGTRVDVLLPTIAIEVEWIKKWKGGIGQALHYGIMTNRAPCLILLTRGKPREKVYIETAKKVCDKTGIALITWKTFE